ncbi:hypothetical protein LDENG_00183890 [Lucifuga dentata]|nr:hypothetical protein LDENG_00183890 [Lucifuga dentata]
MEEVSGEEETEEEQTGDAELDSSERMHLCTLDAEATPTQVVQRTAGTDTAAGESECGSYDGLVSRGRQCYSEGKLDEALTFFLRAIDISPGDPEVQLLTIQLYRRLSQRV